jgi:hypothetical protein
MPMARYLKQNLALLTISGVMSVLLLSAWTALAQSAPLSADRVWHSSEEQKLEQDARNLIDTRLAIDSAKTYTLTELIDLAEAHNPATRLSWERARAQAANLGVREASYIRRSRPLHFPTPGVRRLILAIASIANSCRTLRLEWS